MRASFLVLASVFLACGGKLEASASPDAGPVVTASPPRSCAPPVPATDDFGTLDVSAFGCACTADAECAAGELCIAFAALDTAHCVATDDPCSVVHCHGNGTCIVAASEPMRPICYR